VKCPYCERDSEVIGSRPMQDGIRRRKCTACGRRFTTHERLAPIEVRVTKAGDRGTENFQPEKIRRAVERVARGGPLTARDGVEVALRIKMELIDARRTTVRSGEIAAAVHRLLDTPDADAARRFAVDCTMAAGEVVFDRGEPAGEKEEEKGEQFGLF
jgi:transcriptional repressor NrdR